jgi:ribosomal protein S13
MFIFEHKIIENKRLENCVNKCLGIGKIQSKRLYVRFGLNKIFYLNLNKINTIFQKNNKIYKNDVKDRKKNIRFLKKIEQNIEVKISDLININVGVHLKNYLYFNLKKVRELKSFKALRHYQNLPVRGQRTRTNAQTQKKRNRKIKKVVAVAKKKK